MTQLYSSNSGHAGMLKFEVSG